MLDLTRNIFLRRQRSYFALANIWLHRNDSHFQFYLLLSYIMEVNPDSTTVNNCSIALHNFPVNNYNEPTMPSECNSFHCCKLHNDSK